MRGGDIMIILAVMLAAAAAAWLEGCAAAPVVIESSGLSQCEAFRVIYMTPPDWRAVAPETVSEITAHNAAWCAVCDPATETPQCRAVTGEAE